LLEGFGIVQVSAHRSRWRSYSSSKDLQSYWLHRASIPEWLES